MTILVTGATGHLGALTIDALLARGAEPGDLVAAGRNPDKLAAYAARGIATAVLDFDDPASVEAAVAGTHAVLLVSSNQIGSRARQHRTVIDAAARAGVSKFVYTSAPFATTADFILAPEHKTTEEAIATSGLPAVILRNNWYNENTVGDYAQAAKTGVFLTSAGTGRIAYAARSDYAQAAAVVLLGDEHVGEVLELAGDQALTPDDVAAVFAEVSGRPVTAEHVDAATHRAALEAAGLPSGAVDAIVGIDAGVARGVLGFTDHTLATLIGHPTVPLADTLRKA